MKEKGKWKKSRTKSTTPRFPCSERILANSLLHPFAVKKIDINKIEIERRLHYIDIIAYHRYKKYNHGKN